MSLIAHVDSCIRQRPCARCHDWIFKSLSGDAVWRRTKSDSAFFVSFRWAFVRAMKRKNGLLAYVALRERSTAALVALSVAALLAIFSRLRLRSGSHMTRWGFCGRWLERACSRALPPTSMTVTYSSALTRYLRAPACPSSNEVPSNKFFPTLVVCSPEATEIPISGIAGMSLRSVRGIYLRVLAFDLASSSVIRSVVSPGLNRDTALVFTLVARYIDQWHHPQAMPNSLTQAMLRRQHLELVTMVDPSPIPGLHPTHPLRFRRTCYVPVPFLHRSFME